MEDIHMDKIGNNKKLEHKKECLKQKLRKVGAVLQGTFQIINNDVLLLINFMSI